MAHHFKIVVEPHINKGKGKQTQGEPSKTKKDYVVVHRGRGGRYTVGVATSTKAADQMVEDERLRLRRLHDSRYGKGKHTETL